MKTKKLIKLVQNSINKNHNCDECDSDDEQEQQIMGQSLKDRIWAAYLQEKKIILNGEIKEDLIEKAVMQIFTYNEYDAHMLQTKVGYQPEPIKIFINSNGGLLDESFSLISAIEASNTPVVTIGLGKVYSGAFLILLSGHARFAQTFCSFMHHQSSSGVGGEFSRMIEYAKHWEKCQSIVDEYVIKKTKIKRKKLNEIFHGKQDWFLGSQEALELGIIDAIWKF